MLHLELHASINKLLELIFNSEQNDGHILFYNICIFNTNVLSWYVVQKDIKY